MLVGASGYVVDGVAQPLPGGTSAEGFAGLKAKVREKVDGEKTRGTE